MAKDDKKETKSSENKDQTYKGTVIAPFKVKDKEYNVDDSYETKDKFSYNYLRNNHKIK